MLTVLCSNVNRRIRSRVLRTLEDEGVPFRCHDLDEERFAPCQGCFNCWVVHPGQCKASDHANEVMRDAIAADGLVWLTRPRFGAWDPLAKGALDKTIGLLSPFFGNVEGETHHLRRYRRYPQWAVLAETTRHDDPGDFEAFETLVRRNALNLHCRSPLVTEVRATDSDTSLGDTTETIVRYLSKRHASDATAVEPHPPVQSEGFEVGERRVVLWVGSAKPTGTSTSEGLGRALVKRLEERGWASEIVWSAKSTHGFEPGSWSLVEAAQRASLVVLASPVYFDSLPALVLRGLADLADAEFDRRPALLPIVQCGFPESNHTRLAIDAALRAARSGGFPWAGHWAAGGGRFHGSDVDAHARHKPLQEAFDRMADALHEGHPIPAELTRAAAEPAVPAAIYRAVGQVGWVVDALRRGSVTQLWSTPFQPDRTRDTP